MGFDLSGLPDHGSIEIDSAILTLTMLYALEVDTIVNIGFRSLKYNLIEGTSQVYKNATDSSFTWSARIFMDNVDTVSWQIDGVGGAEDREDSIYSVSPGIGGSGVYRVDVTGLVAHWMDSSATERWCLLADTCAVAKSYGRKVFSSSENSAESSRPELEIFYHSLDIDERWRYHALSGGLLR